MSIRVKPGFVHTTVAGPLGFPVAHDAAVSIGQSHLSVATAGNRTQTSMESFKVGRHLGRIMNGRWLRRRRCARNLELCRVSRSNQEADADDVEQDLGTRPAEPRRDRLEQPTNGGRQW